jgi:very-short-patch-repair endonuclease
VEPRVRPGHPHVLSPGSNQAVRISTSEKRAGLMEWYCFSLSHNFAMSASAPPPRVGGLAVVLDDVRKELLDFSLRNPFLNYRLLKSRGLEVVERQAKGMHCLLVTEEKQFSFLPVEDQSEIQVPLESPDEEASDIAAELRSPPHASDEGCTDTDLQTTLTSKQLQTRLLATYYTAKTSIEEQGVNTLFLALGMLHWREADSAEEIHRAPLILIPVELERSNARARFSLAYNGEELGGNVTLGEYLKQNFGIRFPELPEGEEIELTRYLESVESAIASQKRWFVDRRAVVLGFFSFSKFLMYRDLDPDTWPADKSSTGQDLLRDLLGAGTLGGKASAYSEGDFVDNHLVDRKIFEVMDADSSQTLALLDISDGHNMVIQGPPGTGKSQTIVNAIADALASEKTVLFVSEKLVALDVVKRRLDAAGFGSACLELHSKKASKKTVIEDLKRTAHTSAPQILKAESELAALAEMRRRLNEYCRAVNLPVGRSAETPCSLYGRLMPVQKRLAQLPNPRLQLESAVEWNEVDLGRKRAAIASIQRRVSRAGVPVRHPFWGSRLRMFLPTQRDGIQHTLLQGAASLQALTTAGQAIAQWLDFPAPILLADTLTVCATCHKLSSAPRLQGVKTRAAEWTTRAMEIRAAILAGRDLRELHEHWDPVFRENAWEQDVSAVRRDLAELGSLWWRFLSSRWRSAKKNLSMLIRNPLPKSLAGSFEITDAILEAQRIEAFLVPIIPVLSELFGAEWRGYDSDWRLLLEQFDWIASAIEAIRENSIAEWSLDVVQRHVDQSILAAHISVLDLALQNESRMRSEIVEVLDFDLRCPRPIESWPLIEIQDRWSLMASSLDELESLVAYNQAADQCRAESLDAVVSVADNWENASTHLVDLFDKVHISSLIEIAFRERPALATFDGLEQNEVIEQFRELDRHSIEVNRLEVARRHAQRMPGEGGANGQIAVLRHEFEKKGRFLPLRTLMTKAGNAIQAMKPVFLMSPLSIANFVPPGTLEFDLVIFDEASQVRPADSLGAILRARQVVVVGDSKQLPPTDFFDTLAAQEEDADEEESASADIESILGLFCARGAHQRMLRWHYRSRHESLIAVSNHLFYDNRLFIFPSPDHERVERGLIYHRLENATYDRSRTRTNPAEAKAVAEAVITHAHEQLRKPQKERLTLGVAAFSVAQRDAILQNIEVLRRQNPACDEFFSFDSHERFFVKNLENVQGDERDVMFISIGYGRTADGYIAMGFGPLNRAGGERRLNVLVTRARYRCEVFTNLSADDIDLDRTDAAGVAALKVFLAYAATGKIDIPVATGRPQDSVFEEQVLDALARKGYKVHAQVGCAGFFLDLAVVDSQRPGRYLLGIECDGAAYHSALSARDRDRLRQAVLEGLGWQIHRIWSTDWFRNPERELSKVIQVIELAKQRPEQTQVESTEAYQDFALRPLIRADSGKRNVNQIAKYKIADLTNRVPVTDLHLADSKYIVQWLVEVVEVESPVHWLEATRRVANAAGVQRLGSRIQAAFRDACGLAFRSGLFSVRNEFLWRIDTTAPVLRDRSDLPQSVKKIEYIAPEEICAALERVAQDSYGVAPGDIATGAGRLLGFARVTDEMRAVLETHRDFLISAGRLILKGESLVFERTGS